MRVFIDIFGGINTPARYRCGIQRFQYILQFIFGSPVANYPVQHFRMPRTAVVMLKLGVLGQVGPTNGVHQPLENPVAVAGNRHIVAVFTQIGVGRHDTRQRRAGSLAYGARGGVFGNQAFHHGKHRFV